MIKLVNTLQSWETVYLPDCVVLFVQVPAFLNQTCLLCSRRALCLKSAGGAAVVVGQIVFELFFKNCHVDNFLKRD